MTFYSKEKRTILYRNIFTALLYGGLGISSLTLELVPEIATPIWPAAGIALGAVLLWGNHVLPGVFLGTFCTNVFAVTQTGAASTGTGIILVPLGISVAVFLQAWLGAKLIKSCVRFPGYLEGGRDIALFLLLGAPIGCLISSSLAVSWLGITGIITKEAFFFQWFTWWAGDTIGVLIAAPLFILLASSASIISVKRKMTVALPLVGIAAASFAVFLWVKHVEEKSVYLRFQTEVTGQTDKVEDYLQGLMNVLHSVAGLHVASEDVTDEEFQIFTRYILERYSEIQSVQWAPYITEDERKLFEQNISAARGEDFHILDQLENGDYITAPRRADYFPVHLSTPINKNSPKHGFDIGAVFEKRQALEKSITEKSPQASSPGKLFGGARGIIIADPVFKNHHDKNNGHVTGFVIATLNMQHLINNLLSPTKQHGINIKATDAATTAHNGTLFESEVSQQPILQDMRQINIAGRLWNISYTATPEYFSTYRPWAVWFTMIGGVAFVSLLQFLLLMITGQTSATERIVAERTQALKKSNTELEQFAYAASHDLKTPLRHISICAEFINDGNGNRLAKETREYLGIIRKSTQHMSALIDSLLDYARINHTDNGQQEKTSLNDVFDTVTENMGSVITENNATITRDDLPVIYSHGPLLSRVFLNLLDNALKYKDPERPPRIHVSCQRHKDEWIISVTDNGIGIAPQFADKIFEVFQRLHSEDAYTGTGIGLPACKRIIEYHKGRIWLDTDYKGGSRFCFTLPHQSIL